MAPTKPLRILVTGASQGLGTQICLAALRSGHTVLATARNPSKASQNNPEVEKLGGIWAQLDVTSSSTEKNVRTLVSQHLNNDLDVLINNAGFAMLGAVEDISDAEVTKQLDTNFNGPLRTMRAVLPGFREKKGGLIMNISSGAAFLGLPARGVYAASKAALEAASESLQAEVEGFGVRIIVVDLGAFRTEFSDSSSVPAAFPDGVSPGYIGSPVHKMLEGRKGFGSRAPGDTVKAAECIVEAAEGKIGAGQLRLILGSDCLARARQASKIFLDNIDAMEDIAKSTDIESS